MKQSIEDYFQVSSYNLNEYTGVLKIAEYIVSNKNGKQDKEEYTKILLFDLKTMMHEQTSLI